MNWINVALAIAIAVALPAAAAPAGRSPAPFVLPVQAVEPRLAPQTESEPEAEPEAPAADAPEEDEQPTPRALALAKVALASVLVGKCEAIEFQDESLATYFLENIGQLDDDTRDLLSGLAFAAATVLGDKSVQEICDEAVAKFGPDGSEAKGLVARK